jgi:[acyl-carrier-protein] S-malonyltransferase
MQEASDLRQGGMVAITGLDEEDLLKLCEDSKVIAATQDRDNFDTELYLGIGNYLSDKHFTVSGDISACIALQEAALLRQEVKVVKLLAVSGAFHTPLMSPAQHALSAILEETSFTPETMSCPVYSNVTGDSYYYHDSTSQDIKTALLVQLVQPVMWNKSMSLLLSHPSFQQAYEVGPGSVCSGIVKAHNRRAKVKPYKL